jgi:hypothetical protein
MLTKRLLFVFNKKWWQRMKLNTPRVGLAAIALVAVATLFSLYPSAPALSVTGEDVIEKMSSDHRAGYLTGSVEMAAFMAGMDGDRARADCIMTWFYDRKGTKEVVDALAEYKDRQALPVVMTIINRACER